ncbi:unnamed protein product [Brassica napus]|uniref:(rape) hypothetical protein n=1 Tax=Brassica napus TaxID=3708 RepID=A0A816LZG0_BRANA|nr:unnamed protein product [Brassica napus]
MAYRRRQGTTRASTFSEDLYNQPPDHDHGTRVHSLLGRDKKRESWVVGNPSSEIKINTRGGRRRA